MISPARQTSPGATFSDSEADSTAPCTPDERLPSSASLPSSMISKMGPAARWSLSQRAWLATESGWRLDGSRELSRLMKEATAKAHEDVLRPPVVNKLITGQIPLDVHIRYLIMLHCVYEGLESALARHASHPILAPTHSPAILARTQSIAEDIVYFLKLSNGSDWTSHPTAVSVLSNPPRALTAYIERIHSLEYEDRSYTIQLSSSKPFVYAPPPAAASLLLAHAYVRYMGDLNGGQMIKNSVANAYQIDQSQTDGLRFYRFENALTGDASSPAQISKLASSFRKGLDLAGIVLSPAQRAAMLQEANHAFELNVAIFSSFSEEDEAAADAFGPVRRTLPLNATLQSLSPSEGVGIPAIPSPSLEGYAKAATYMPKGSGLTPTAQQRQKPSVYLNASAIAIASLAVVIYLLRSAFIRA